MSDILVAVDTEKAGSFLNANPIISVGFVVGEVDGRVIETRRFNIAVAWYNDTCYYEFESRCVNEFWSKLDPKFIEDCKVDARHPDEQWREIGRWIDDLEVRFTGRRIRFLTNNADFDIAAIDWALERYTGRRPMRYSKSGEYRSVNAADDMFDMLTPEQKEAAARFMDTCSATHNGVVLKPRNSHNPVEDAFYIYLQYVCALKFRHYSPPIPSSATV